MADRAEILSPGGDMEKLRMALRYGADAAYFAGKAFGMRAAAGNFDEHAIKEAVSMCHASQAKAYITCNIVPGDEDISLLPPFLELLQDIGADSIIVTDLGVLRLIKRYDSKLPIHVSTQAGIMNSESANMWYELGASRVVLARELTLDAIAAIRAKTPKALEIETFVHGSMCMSVSGRCLLSNYMTGRDANRGDCAQPCRWKYYLMEEKRPGEFFEIYEEENGTHILNSKDLCMIEHIPELLSAGIDSFKIEGRMKSSYYAAVVTNAYKKAQEAVLKGEKVPQVWLDEVNKVSHRRYYTGFYFGDKGKGQFYENSLYIRDWEISAIVESCDTDGRAVLTQRNKLFSGEKMELLTPDDEPFEFLMGEMMDTEGKLISSTPHPMMKYMAKLPHFAPPYSILRKQN
jgi:putative protease